MEPKLILGDCIEKMAELDAASVNLCCTSPPYFVEKSYEKDWTLPYFKQLMADVFSGVNRLLVPGGYFVVNFGDAYNSGNRFYEAEVPSVFPTTVWYYEWGRSVGLDLQATRIWRKRFAKMSIPFVCNSRPRPVFDYEHIWTFRKRGGDGKEAVHDRKLSQRAVLGEEWGSSAKLGINGASFPVELPRWAISVYSKEGDTVLDPFSGTGTTGIAALGLKRKYIGIELCRTTYDYAIERIARFHNTSLFQED